MERCRRRILGAGVMGGLLLLGQSLALDAVAASRAGKVAFAFGQVSAADSGGKTRRLARGSQVFSGDTITTGRSGRVQVRFLDGGFISLIPNTRFQVEDFQFRGKDDSAGRSLFRLFKGGLRAITGAIARVARKNYRVSTPVATIGIRGTWYRALLDDAGRLLVSVGFDPADPTAIVVSNDAGEIVVGRGQNAVVESAEAPPRLTSEQATVTAAPPAVAEEPEFVAGDERDQGGNPVTVAPAAGGTFVSNLIVSASEVEPTAPPPRVDSDLLRDITVFFGSPPVGAFGLNDIVSLPGGPETSLAVIDLDKVTAAAKTLPEPTKSEVLKFIAEAKPSLVDLLKAKPAVAAEFDDSDVVNAGGLRWGRWANGRILFVDKQGGVFTTEVDDLTGNQSLHFIAGTPPTGSLPVTGTATYTFFGGTRSTSEAGTIGTGVTEGTLSVHFDPTRFVSINMKVTHNPTYTLSGSVDFDSSGVFFSKDLGGSVSAFSSDGGCTSCSADIDGFLSGPATASSAPPRAGLTYVIRDSDPVHGAAAFKQTNFVQ